MSGGRSRPVEVSDNVLDGQDGRADAAHEQDQHPDRIQVGRDKPEHADDEPQHDDQGYRCYVVSTQ